MLLESWDKKHGSRSLLFQFPDNEIQAWTVSEVADAMKRIENAVNAGFHTAGFLLYESAPAFDNSLCVKDREEYSGLPSLWFGIYKECKIINVEETYSENGHFCLGEWIPSISSISYGHSINSIKEFIANGDTYQVNFTFRLKTDFEGDDFAFYRSLCMSQRAGYCAYISLGRYRIICASPELFFELKNRRIKTRPMKGTQKRGRFLEEDEKLRRSLHVSPKNRAENVMIVDLLRNDLGKISDIGSVNVQRLFDVETYETLHQMTSTITGSIRNNVSIFEIFQALFPSGSVTGAPKIRTMEIISELEDSPRGIYTGAIGFISPGPEAVFNVAIRTVLLDTETGIAEFGVGGGITHDSEIESEYEECLLKAKFLNKKSVEFGLVESLLYEANKRSEIDSGYFLLDRHLERLNNSAIYFGFNCDIEIVRRDLIDFSKKIDSGSYKVRLLLYRNGKIDLEGEEILKKFDDKPIKVFISSEPVNTQDSFLFHKTTNRYVYETRLKACKEIYPECDDVILINERGEITESSIANVVVMLNGKALTPPIESGLLAGTYRSELLSRGEIIERKLTPYDLIKAERIFLINSVRKWKQVELKNNFL